ncbi:hypothetical protein TSUD_169240 [Trifolium subterraneum]|nr:hypothetical protein TSUD_169240 [Trifolium subterraneum]
MGRPKNNCWVHATKVKYGSTDNWICNYCKEEFSGGASRIKAHLGLDGKSGNIKKCSKYGVNEEVHNNMASTSSNPPQVVINTIDVTHDQGTLEVINTQINNLANHQNNLEMMNLSEGVKLDEDDERARADNLSLALETKEKLVLILDDVWKYIDLEKVGIHPKVNGIKVIMTTRLKHVCHQMDCQPYAIIRMFPLSCYNEDEFEEDDDEVGQDLKLFKLKLGHDEIPKTLPDEIENIANCIVERFKGLPLGINVMARTMKGIDDIHQWKHALNKFQRFEMGPEVEEEVLKVLKRSYDNLMDKDLQNCFLYCALLSNWNEDEKSKKDDLIMRLVDCGQMNKNICLEEIFNEGNAILKKLDSHSLISFVEDYVFIHPLVRSMACYIKKESQRNVIVELNDTLNQIPLSRGEIWATDLQLVCMEYCDTVEISDGLSPNCPKLSTLILKEMSISKVPESFFKYMNILTILDLSFNGSLVSLPNFITNLRSLVSLTLKRCRSLKHVPPLGELQALSRLVISYTSIEEAPQGLEKLTNLKWLDLSYNTSLNLELASFSFHLTKLQYLDLQFTCALIMFEDVQRMKKLECFRGAIDRKLQNPSMQHRLDMSFGFIKTYHLILENECGKSLWGPWKYMNLISFFPDDAESRLCGALSYSTSSSLRKIEIKDCHQLRLTVICKDVVDVGQSLSSGVIFSCLKEIYIYTCNSIEKLLTPKLVQQLHNLETIDVRMCDSMEEIFAVNNSDDNDSSIITLPKLTRLELRHLPELKIVCEGIIHCRSSPEVIINDCPSLERQQTKELRFHISDFTFP